MSYNKVQQLADKFNKLAGEVVDFQAEKEKRSNKSLLVFGDGTYGVPEDCELLILTSKGINELGSAQSFEDLNKYIIDRKRVSDLLSDYLKKFNC